MGATLTMGHQINGLLATKEHLDRLAEQLGLSQSKRLRQDFGFLPLDDEDLDRIFVQPGSYHSEFIYLSAALVSLLLEHSTGKAIAYIETDYFGGMGDQSAVLARSGKLVFGPTRGPGSINRVLQIMGVAKFDPDLDEFDTIGLDQIRSNDAMDLPLSDRL